MVAINVLSLCSPRLERKIHRPWRKGVIVKLLGRMMRYKALETRLKQMWVRKWIINIIDLSHDYDLVAFTHEEDKHATLKNGPWFTYDHYLTVKDWSLDFHADYYDPRVLHFIGNRVSVLLRLIKIQCNMKETSMLGSV